MLNIDLEQLGALGTQIVSKADNFNELLQKINKVNETLAQYWQGADAAKYTETVAKQAEEMARLHKTIEECGNYILSARDAYQNALSANLGE